MKRIGTGILLIAAVVSVVLWGHPLLLVAAQLLFSIVGLWEFFRLAEAAHFRVLRFEGYLCAVLLGINNVLLNRTQIETVGSYTRITLDPTAVGMMVIFSIVLVLMMVTALRPSRSSADYIGSVAVSFLGSVYVVLPLALLVSVCMQLDGPFLVLYALVVIWAGDTAGYFIGKNLGKHKSSPRISPNKTWEGTLASLISALLVGLITARYFWGNGYVEPILLAAALNVAGQFGDLAESALKRSAGVKDSSNLIPGHGGVLDRIDALLFAAPILWYYWLWRVG